MKTKIYFFLLFVIACLSLSLQGKENPDFYTVDSFQEVEKYITPQSFVILDLDHTIFEAASLGYGHANWFYDQVEKGKKVGLSKNEVIMKFYPHWALAQRLAKIKPVEEMIPSFIKNCQQKNIPIIGATSRQTSIAHSTLEQLHSLGINFGQVLHDEANPQGFAHPTLLKESVIFCSDYNEKGPVVLAYLKAQGPLPKHIVFVDDGVNNLLSVKKAFAGTGTKVVPLHYRLVEKRTATTWNSAKGNQAYYQVYLENPILPPFFLEQPERLAVQYTLLEKNAQIRDSYEFTMNGKRFIGLPDVFSPKVFGEDNALHQAIPIQKQAEILEIGPATGHFSVMAALNGAKKVVAVDISPRAVENTQRNAARYKVTHIVDARCGDIFSPVKGSEKFDVIFWDIPFNHREKASVTFLEKSVYDPNHQLLTRFVKEAGKYLKPEGAVYLSYSPTHGNEDYLTALAEHYHWQLKKVKQVGEPDTIQVALYELRRS